MARELMPMRMNVASSTGRRPYLSPRWPQMTAPSGRARNPTPNVAKDAIRAPASPRPEKKSTGKIVADSAP